MQQFSDKNKFAFSHVFFDVGILLYQKDFMGILLYKSRIKKVEN